MVELSPPDESEYSKTEEDAGKQMSTADKEPEIEEENKSEQKTTVRVASIGNVDSGKSTLVGMLTS